ncbi:MAG: rod shape-determining protein MreC [Gammaproteobacteria bacterium]|nr:MAG: rod shape-determining protein MreC [Gammaproteobacteria bacterium]
MKPLFVKQTSVHLRLVLVLAVAIAFIAFDLFDARLDKTRSVLTAAVQPFIYLADLPARLVSGSQGYFQSRDQLIEQNQRLRRENLVLQGRSLQMVSLRTENTRLRALLNSGALLQDDILVGEVIGVTPDPARHEIIINRGAADGAYPGQPLIDDKGLVGQVLRVSENQARALLVSDATHAVPVQVNRNAVRGVAEGVGRLDVLELHHIPATTDIHEGDVLVTSGLGGRFPKGYPVAVVSMVERSPGQAFAKVLAAPMAALDRGRYVLLVFSGVEQQ